MSNIKTISCGARGAARPRAPGGAARCAPTARSEPRPDPTARHRRADSGGCHPSRPPPPPGGCPLRGGRAARVPNLFIAVSPGKDGKWVIDYINTSIFMALRGGTRLGRNRQCGRGRGSAAAAMGGRAAGRAGAGAEGPGQRAGDGAGRPLYLRPARPPRPHRTSGEPRALRISRSLRGSCAGSSGRRQEHQPRGAGQAPLRTPHRRKVRPQRRARKVPIGAPGAAASQQ
ncbi:bcl-2-binding component 3, isoforms 3/4-like [Pipra filicauda]|uniref:Bcl-2-binding component 3, isoforms 3/4-like n=1 Tax=Pipra filicauda TaxID=649802 RepID=A0A7R5KZM6_9PASS|nr:bcl-2-binding component 3, isoforms 3/4-like [Pipra filicauda]